MPKHTLFTGRVVDPDGIGLRGRFVSAYANGRTLTDGWGIGPYLGATTASDGTFEISAWDDDFAYELTVPGDDVWATERVGVVRAPSVGLGIELAPAVRFTVRVRLVDRSGAPVAGARLETAELRAASARRSAGPTLIANGSGQVSFERTADGPALLAFDAHGKEHELVDGLELVLR